VSVVCGQRSCFDRGQTAWPSDAQSTAPTECHRSVCVCVCSRLYLCAAEMEISRHDSWNFLRHETWRNILFSQVTGVYFVCICLFFFGICRDDYEEADSLLLLMFLSLNPVFMCVLIGQPTGQLENHFNITIPCNARFSKCSLSYWLSHQIFYFLFSAPLCPTR